MTTNVDTKPRARRVGSQVQTRLTSPVVTEVRTSSVPSAFSRDGDRFNVGLQGPRPKTTRLRFLTVTQRSATYRSSLQIWSLLVPAFLFVGPVAVFELVFGGGVGATAAGTGVACGLAAVAASTYWRWDAPTTVLSVVVTCFLIGSGVALCSGALYGFLPTGQTLQVMVPGSFRARKDLLMLTPLVSIYSGPALVPWMCGLVLAVLADLITARAGRAVPGSTLVVAMTVIVVFSGLIRYPLPLSLVLVWRAFMVAWWTSTAQHQRITLGQDVPMGRASSPGGEATVGRRSHPVVCVGRRAPGVIAVLTVSVGMAMPAATALGFSRGRLVRRDLIQPPIDVQAFPSPMSSLRHYTTDLKDETLLTVSDLPKNQRVRIAATNVYDGTTFGMSRKRDDGHTGYILVHTIIPGHVQDTSAATLTTTGLSGPWALVPGTPSQIVFTGKWAARQKKGPHVDTWANAILTTGPVGSMSYNVTTDFVAPVHDEELVNSAVVSVTLEGKNVPDGLADKAAELTQNVPTPLAAVRAIEHYLSTDDYYLNGNTRFSRPGVRNGRLERVLVSDENPTGDGQQYTAPMTLMLHQSGINARVVMGAHPESGPQGGAATLRESDIRAWVEVEFSSGVWDMPDLTPPCDRTSQTQVSKPHPVPCPQVLQPSGSPEPPAEMSPPTRNQNADPLKPPEVGLSWDLIVVGSGAIILLAMSLLAILMLKAGRRRRRRRVLPGEALVGSWDEVVDLAADYGLRIDLGHTRREIAWTLSSEWELGQDLDNPSALVTDEVNLGEDGATLSSDSVGAADKGRCVTDGWSRFGGDVPAPVVIACFAGVVNFASNGFSRDSARAVWAQAKDLCDQVSECVGFLARVRRVLSLRSLRMYRKLRRDTPLVGRMIREENDQ